MCAQEWSTFKFSLFPEACSERSYESKIELFKKIVNNWNPLTIFAKRSILDTWAGYECIFAYITVKLTLYKLVVWDYLYAMPKSSKLVSAIFIKLLFFHQMIALQKLWKMFFISSKKLFSFSRYLDFCIFFSSFPQLPDSKGHMEVE